MKLKYLKTLVFLLAGGVVFFWFQEARAEETLNRARFIDEATMQKGYTVPSKHYDFLVGIRGGIFNEAAWVKIKETDIQGTVLPEEKELISQVYTYDIRVSNPQVLERPVFISLEFDSDTPYKKRFHFWNRVTGEWQEIPTDIDFTNNIAKAAIHFPWSKVAVFEDPTKLDEPVKITSNQGPSIQSTAAIVIDAKSGKVLYSKKPNKVWWIASLTKLMTAVVFLETNPDFNEVVAYSSADDTMGGRLRVSDGETMTIKDLFYSLLVGSANNTANTIQRSTGLTREEFVARMNAKAQEWGLANTTFTDPSGLDLGNQSTTADFARLMQTASQDFRILQATTTPLYSFSTINTGKPHHIENTNKLLDSKYYFLSGKTGYLDEAMYNFTAKVRNGEGNEIITVLLGAGADWIRWQETSALIDWTYDNWEW